MRIRNAGWLLRALSLLAIAALVMTPACAPLCAGQNCGPAAASAEANESCHRAGAMHHETLFVHGIRNCNLPELPAVVSTSIPFGGAPGVSRLSASGGIYVTVEQENSPPRAYLSHLWFFRPHDFSSGFAPVPSGVLRI